jgi:hypothetical protein
VTPKPVRRTAREGGTLTYLYCLVKSAKRPAGGSRLRSALPGAGPVRALDAGGGLWLIAADVPADDYSEAAITAGLRDLDWVSQRAVGHEGVVEHFLGAAALLPMQLFTIFTSDERALEHVAADRRRIDRVIARIAGQVEWGLRLAWDDTTGDPPKSKATRPPTGTAYLARKRDLIDTKLAEIAAARKEANRLFRQMSKVATETRRHTGTEKAAPGSRLLIAAAYLVPAKREAAFRKALRTHASALGGHGLVISLTGPWPPYNFIQPPRAPRRAQSSR